MAYAAFNCLLSTIHQSMEMTQLDLQPFYDKIVSLRAILESPRKSTSYHDEALISLESRIAKLAYTAASMTESLSKKHRLFSMLAKRGRTRYRSNMVELCPYLDKAVQGIDSVMRQWMAILDHHNSTEALKAKNLVHVSKPGQSVESENVMVGLENEFDMLLDQLAGGGDLEVVSLVGMGGIGKTTLCSKIYTYPFIMSRFETRAKVTVSQEYSVRNVLLSLLTSIDGERYYWEDDGKLADQLQKHLKGKRYLIFIDDIWTTQAWDDIKLCFPDCSNGSRILLTTRNMEVAEYASTGMPPYRMRLLNSDDCWSLMQKRVFVNDYFPPEFEQIGKQIALNCRGLPLAIVVIAGLLSKIGKVLHEWESVAENVTSSVITDVEGQCMRVLALSYYHLPHHLKSCFLYLAIFPEDELIYVNRLLKLWAAEEFLKVEEVKSIEEVAEQCLKELIDRSLVSIQYLSFSGKLKACGMHDVIREVCLREARSINLLNVVKECDNRPEQSRQKQHGHIISIQSEHSTCAVAQLATGCYDECRSIILFNRDILSPSKMPELVHFETLRVLDLASLKLDGFPSCMVNLFHLRYLSLRVAFTESYCQNVYIPQSIANLQYLQTLILKCSRFCGFAVDELHNVSSSRIDQLNPALRLPLEVFKMSQLRHLSLGGSYLYQNHEFGDSYMDQYYELGESYLNHELGERNWILTNLQSLYGWDILFCNSSVFGLFPNVNKLKICSKETRSTRIEDDMKGLHDLCYLEKLEELTFKDVPHLVLPAPSAFPKNLKKLAFSYTNMSWDDLRIVGKLPKLEALKLGPSACSGRKWEVVEEGFPRLKFLQLNHLSIEHWEANSDQFPCLERLFLRSCRYLDSIPQDFVEITTLDLIHVEKCRDSLENSAKKIQQEAKDNYGATLEVRAIDNFLSYSFSC